MHYDGTLWSASLEAVMDYQPGQQHLPSGVWANAPNDVFVVMTGGHIVHYDDGVAWTLMTSPTTEGLGDVWGNSGSHVYAVGAGGVFHDDGATWSDLTHTPGIRVWGTATDVFVLTEGVILLGKH